MVSVSTVVLARLLDRDDFVWRLRVDADGTVRRSPDARLGPALIYYAEDERYKSTGFLMARGAAARDRLGRTALRAPVGDPSRSRAAWPDLPIEALANARRAAQAARVPHRDRRSSRARS
jgi:hypothetical protein